MGSFSDGMAWVSRDGLGRWVAIDKANRVVIPAGFDDVRPFRRGIAIARQGGKWGAIERNGRLAVKFAFDAFVTGLADGRYVEGFTDEGLAIVEVAGRRGVIDRTGRVIVPLAYPTMVIHPVAFLFTDAQPPLGRHRPQRAAADQPDAPEPHARSPTSSSSCWPTPARSSDAAVDRLRRSAPAGAG